MVPQMGIQTMVGDQVDTAMEHCRTLALINTREKSMKKISLDSKWTEIM